MEMLLAGYSNDERLQAWYQCTSWVERRRQEFDAKAFVAHSLSYTPFCCFSILVRWKL